MYSTTVANQKPCTIVAGRSPPYTNNAVTRWALFVRNKSMGYYYTHSVVSLLLPILNAVPLLCVLVLFPACATLGLAFRNPGSVPVVVVIVETTWDLGF